MKLHAPEHGRWVSRGIMGRFAAVSLLVLYFGGCAYFNDLVRGACTHGNCQHGWYSKFNSDEKALARAWRFGFPLAVGAFLVWRLSRSERDTRKDTGPTNTIVPARLHQTPPQPVQQAPSGSPENDSEELLEKYHDAHFPTFTEASKFASEQAKLHKIYLRVEKDELGWRVFNPNSKARAIFVAKSDT